MKYELLPRFILRLPLLSYESESLHNLFREKESLDLFLSDKNIRDAIYIASPILYKEINKLLNNEIPDRKEKEKILSSLIRYLSRMSTRCTPFGLFAGCATGQMGPETAINIPDRPGRTTRLDMQFLCAFYNHLIRIPQIKDKLRYYPNTSLYPIGRKYRYIETSFKGTQKKYHLTALEHSGYLATILKAVEKGMYLHELIPLLTREEVTEEEAKEYLYELIDSQILISQWHQSVIGEDYLTRLIQMIEEAEYTDNEVWVRTKELHQLVKKLDAETEEEHTIIYQEIIRVIRTLGIPYDEKYLFQVDSVRYPSTATLGHNVAEDLKSAVTFLNRITPVREKEVLSQFKKDFYNRYEEQEVPLMEVLDQELGIGYPSHTNNGDVSPLIDDFATPSKQQAGKQQITPLYGLLVRKISEISFTGSQEILFTDNDIKSLPPNWDDLPPTLPVMFNLLRADAKETLIKIRSVGGSGAANLLGRFAHTSPEIRQAVEEIIEKENSLLPENTILAEIVHLPEDRTGNILYRPHLRDYEILYLSNSDLPNNKKIPVADLMISVRNNRIRIRSKRLHKEIIPRLTNAHNFQRSTLSVYRFLCDLQTQTPRTGLYFSWEGFDNHLTFLPRVRYKNIILSPAIWKVKTKEMKHLFDIQDEAELISAIDSWRENISLPRYSILPDGDNELYIDWKCVGSVRSLFSIIRKRQQIQLHEFLFDPDTAVVKGEKGNYLNEFIVSLYKV